jgi:di/tricarboxylate transporter
MVYNIGGYRFADFLRIGVPLTLLVGLVTVLLVPLVWAF